MEFLQLRLVLTMVLISSACHLLADEPARPPVNPALIYWQAFSSLEDLVPAESKALTDFLNQPALFDRVKAGELLSKRERALNRFLKATGSPAECDWGLTYEDGPFLALPHVSKIQVLSRLALLKAELLFAEHKTQEAMDWLISAHRAARHCGSGDLIMPVLAQFQMEQAAIRVSAMHVLDWDAGSRNEYLARWNALPPLHTVKNAIKGELQFIDWLEKFWLQDAAPKIDPDIVAVTTPDDGDFMMNDEEKAEAEKMVAQFTAENIRKWIHEMRDLYLRIQTALDKPWMEGNPELLALQSEYKNSDNLLMRMASPMPLNKVNDHSFKTATYHTMFKAALEQGHPLDASGMSTYKDSFTGSPFKLIHSSDDMLIITLDPESSKRISGRVELALNPPKRK
jgi:hypothetical protein